MRIQYEVALRPYKPIHFLPHLAFEDVFQEILEANMPVQSEMPIRRKCPIPWIPNKRELEIVPKFLGRNESELCVIGPGKMGKSLRARLAAMTFPEPHIRRGAGCDGTQGRLDALACDFGNVNEYAFF